MNGNTRTQHLTDAEFADLLAGYLPGTTAENHLVSCEHCRAELEIVQGSLGSFRTMGTAWAQAEAPRRVPLPSRLALRLGVRPSWGAGLAAMATAAVLVFGMDLPSSHLRQGPALHPASPAPSNAVLAEDNRLMLSIDQELSSSTFAADALESGQPPAARRSVTTVAD